MKRFTMMLAAICALSISSAAWAQSTPATAPVDPVKMDLARQLIASNGGEQQFDAQLKGMFGALKGGIGKSFAPEQSQLVDALYGDMQDEMIKMAPQLLDLSARLYAENFTEKELRDLLAFRMSDSGQSISAKMPAVQRQAIAETMPLVMSMMPSIMQKTLDRVCEEKHCTTAQRKMVADAMAKAMPHQAS